MAQDADQAALAAVAADQPTTDEPTFPDLTNLDSAAQEALLAELFSEDDGAPTDTGTPTPDQAGRQSQKRGSAKSYDEMTDDELLALRDQMTPEQMRAGMSMEGDYRRKTTSLSKREREFAQRMDQVQADLNQQMLVIQQQVAAGQAGATPGAQAPQGPQMPTLVDEYGNLDPAALTRWAQEQRRLAQEEARKTAEGIVAGVRDQQDQMRAQPILEKIEKNFQRLEAEFPHYAENDDVKANVGAYMQEYGVHDPIAAYHILYEAEYGRAVLARRIQQLKAKKSQKQLPATPPGRGSRAAPALPQGRDAEDAAGAEFFRTHPF